MLQQINEEKKIINVDEKSTKDVKMKKMIEEKKTIFEEEKEFKYDNI